MRQSQLFSKTRKDAPKDELAKNAKLLIRAGFIHKEMAGVYSLLPLGRMVFENIVGIIRQEMNAIGGQEVSLTALQEKASWEKTDRWDDAKMDVWFKTELKNGTVLGLAATHEEPLTALAREHINSYRDLPKYVYQFQTKFRNETRAKSGLMRCREFVMKDLYSFSADEKAHAEFYDKVRDAYLRIFSVVGLGDKTYLTFASGGSFSKYSHEFQTLTDAGEDVIYVHPGKKIAVNKEVLTDEVLADLGVARDELVEEKAVEVGNIFSLGTRFSEPLELLYDNGEGKRLPVVMGSYGIGPGRLMGTIVELFADDKGIVWPASVAPFQVHLVLLSAKADARAATDALYTDLVAAGVSVLYDDRDIRAGEKFADADLIGIPLRIAIGDKSFADGHAEFHMRDAKPATEAKLVPLADCVKECTDYAAEIQKHHAKILHR